MFLRFCGGSMKAPVVSMAPNKSEPQYIRPLMPPSRAPNVKAAAPVTQRRRSSGAGKKGAVAGKALITTPVPTPLPAEITSRLKSPSAERPKFSDRLNALLRTGVASANHEFEDDKDPYAFVDSEVNRLQQQQQQRPLQQTVRNNVVKRSPAAIPYVNPVIKSKKRKQNNVTVSIPSPKNSSILPQQQQQNVTVQKQQQQQQIIAIQRQQQNLVRQQTQIAVKQQQQQQLAAKQLQQQQQLAAKQLQQQQQLVAKQQQQLIAKQQQQQIAAKQHIQQQQIIARQQVQNIVRQQQQQQQIVSRQEPTTTSANIASSPNATSILRTVKFAEQLNNRRLSLNNDDRLKLINSHNNISNSQQTSSHQPNLVARIPVTLPVTSLPPPSLTPLLKNTSIIEEEKQSTTMNQLQAKIARNKVIGKHRNKITTTTTNSLSSHSQPIIASPSNIISSQQLSKLKERSLLEEQLLLGIKQEKLLSSPSTVKQLQHNPQQIKTVTQHFTFPAKSAGSVVTYKRPLTQSPTSKPDVSLLPCKRTVKRTVSTAEVVAESPSKQQLARIEQRKNDEKAFRQDLFPLGKCRGTWCKSSLVRNNEL